MPTKLSKQSEYYHLIKQAIEFIAQNYRGRPDLDEIASSVHLSKFHFHRIFKEWAGVTPAQFLHFLTVEYAKEQLRNSHSVLEAALDTGLSGPGRLHDLLVAFDAVSPGEYRKHGSDMTIRYGVHPTPFGECLLAVTDRGICALRFLDPAFAPDLLGQLKVEWPLAKFEEQLGETGLYVRRIFSGKEHGAEKFNIFVKGTNFQIQVWKALLNLRPGDMVSYQNIATYLGKDRSERAVGSAVAKNPVAYLIPCHRVIKKNGCVQNYQWGAVRKKALLGWEASRA